MSRTMEEIVASIKERISSDRLEKRKEIEAAALERKKQTFKCNKCKDTGLIILDRDRAARCKCMDRIIMEKKLEKIRDFANIPSSFKDLTVNSFRTDIYSGDSRLVAEYVKAVSIRYIRNFQKAVELGKGLYFYSRLPGSGKTRMAISIGNALMNLYGKGVKYMTVEELLTEIKSSFKDRNVSEKDLQSVAKMVDVLILDDLGVEKISPYSESVLYSIIDHRNDEGKISIFTANQSIENLAYHNRIKSRIGRMAVEIHFPEESIRQEVARSENQDFLDQLLKDS